eukprot:6212392-Pleurochrysis_carterae.AAC.3
MRVTIESIPMRQPICPCPELAPEPRCKNGREAEWYLLTPFRVCSFIVAYAALPNSFAIRTGRYGGAASVPLDRLVGGVHGVAERLCGPCDPFR